MTTMQTIIDRATFITKDIDHDRWPVAEMLLWANEAIDLIAKIHPRSASQYVTLTLAAGARQDLRLIDASKQWIRIHEIVCNVADAGPVGAPIRAVPRAMLDAVSPAWRSATPSSTIKECAMDEREPFTFDVIPPAVAGAKVYALASIKPAPVTAVTDTFPLAHGYDIPATDYVLYRAFSKDANDQTYAARATGHLQAFQLALGVETKGAGPQ